MKNSHTNDKLKQERARLEKQENCILDQQSELMEAFIDFACDFYKTTGERAILELQMKRFQLLPLDRKKKLKKLFSKLVSDREAVRRELARFDELWWVDDEFRTRAEDYLLQVPRACTVESTTPCVPAYKFQRSLQVIMSKVYALLYHFGFEVPEFKEHWKDSGHTKRERVFDIEVNLPEKAACLMEDIEKAIKEYDIQLKELDKLYSRMLEELDKEIFENRKKMWDSL